MASDDDDFVVEFKSGDNTLNTTEQTVNNGAIISDVRKLKIEQIGSSIFNR